MVRIQDTDNIYRLVRITVHKNESRHVNRWDTELELERFRAEITRRALVECLILMANVSEEELSYLYVKTRVFVRLGFNENGTE